MDCYIVRIYRRGESRAGNIIGLVEIVGRETQTAFKNAEELVAIIGKDSDRSKKKSKVNLQKTKVSD